MYDEYARHLIELIPDFPGVDRDGCRRALSAAYFHVVRSRLNVDQDAVNQSDLEEVQSTLRRLGDSLESVAVFDRLNGQEWPSEIVNASAFVAAEALVLLSGLQGREENNIAAKDPLQITKIYVAIESALLYMIGGYDINAASAVREIEPVIPQPELRETISGALIGNSDVLLARILDLCRGQVRRPRSNFPLIMLSRRDSPADNYDILVSELRIRFYERIALALDAYLDWLGGYSEEAKDIATRELESIRGAALAKDYPGYTTFADIYHLGSLLLAAMNRTSTRSVTHNVPAPIDGDQAILEDFGAYLRHRSRGDDTTRGKPFLWPSVLEYVATCLPGPDKDAVVAMPTGSGKSSIAELAISHALGFGWVLYLAPTNALAHQIRRDLTHALKPFKQVVVRAFVGSEEYTTLSEEQLNLTETHFVAVMTPEKCALALRLYPERFSNCSLCVFDECHLLSDHRRGVTADILLAQLFILAPKLRLVLMSAMVSNADALAEWLRNSHGGESVPLTIKWRPSRTMRGLLVLAQELLEEEYKKAVKQLQRLPPKRVNHEYDSPLALIAGLSGPWTLSGPPDYRITRLPVGFPAKATRRAQGPVLESWKNKASFILSELFARREIPTICFLLASRHHAFGGADKIHDPLPNAIGFDAPLPNLVEAWLAIADAEFGVATILRDLLRRGVAVHTSAMLSVEQAASEWMFSHQMASLMFATGTLAQGLNLPAIAVVVVGTSMGDPREEPDTDLAGTTPRAEALILNGFGRAGRPGFSNQGIAVLVPDNPLAELLNQEPDPASALINYGVLARPDAAIEIRSPVEAFLDYVLAGEPNVPEATETDLVLTSLLAEYGGEDMSAGKVLDRTLAGYHKLREFTPELVARTNERIATLKLEFLAQPGVPDWMNTAAMKAGVEFFRAWRMWTAYAEMGFVPIEEAATLKVINWLDVFFNVLSRLPPRRIAAYLAPEDKKRATVLTRMRDQVMSRRELDTVPWDMPKDWLTTWQELKQLVLLYMKGASYSEIAQLYLGLSKDQVSNKRSSGAHPIPAVLKFIREVVESLAIDAGCFLALHEFGTRREAGPSEQVPEPLQGLPLCIRNGCDSLGTLSWYRFGFRERVCAHAFEVAFPVPPTLTNDFQRAQWVISTRREWLADRLEARNQPILDHAMTVIKEGTVD